jgi:hypothetical protein
VDHRGRGGARIGASKCTCTARVSDGHHVGVVSGGRESEGRVRRGPGRDVREVGMMVRAGGDAWHRRHHVGVASVRAGGTECARR